MRNIWNGVRLWLVGMIAVSDLWLWIVPQGGRHQKFAENAFQVWKGATEEWSPLAEVDATGDTAGWDLDGWQRDAQRDTHKALQRMERRIDKKLDALLDAVYQWRDADGAIKFKHCWRPGNLGLPRLERVA